MGQACEANPIRTGGGGDRMVIHLKLVGIAHPLCLPRNSSPRSCRPQGVCIGLVARMGGGGFAYLRVAWSALWQVEIAVQPGSIRLVRSLWTLSSEKVIPLLGGAGEFRAERIRGLFAYRLVYSVPQARPVRIAAGYGLEEFEFVARRLNASADCVPQ